MSARPKMYRKIYQIAAMHFACGVSCYVRPRFVTDFENPFEYSVGGYGLHLRESGDATLTDWCSHSAVKSSRRQLVTEL